MENILSLKMPRGFLQTRTSTKAIPAAAASVAGKGSLALRLAQDGDWVRIVAIHGGKSLHERLAGVGLRVGETIQIVNNPMSGKLLIGHNGSRFYLGGGMAHKIQVALVQGENK